MDGEKCGWTGGGRVKKMKEQNKNALKVSVNGVRCVFVAHYRSSGTSESL